MADEPREPQSAPMSAACRTARLALSVIGCLNIVAGAALGAGIVFIAFVGVPNGVNGRNPADTMLYVVLVPLVIFLEFMGVGFLWGRRGVTQGLLRRVEAVKYLAFVNLGIIAIEGVGIVGGLIFDPPKKKEDMQIAVLACAIEIIFLGALGLTLWSLGRVQRFLRELRPGGSA